MPAVVPWYFWDESLVNGFFVASVLRYVVLLHVTWLINSAAHLFGDHPYDKSINPSESQWVIFLAQGEGWHNYHHVFPWDYRADERSDDRRNFTRAVIDFFSRLGLAYDLKTVPDRVVRGRVLRTGDGTHRYSQPDAASPDAGDIQEEESEFCTISAVSNERFQQG